MSAGDFRLSAGEPTLPAAPFTPEQEAAIWAMIGKAMVAREVDQFGPGITEKQGTAIVESVTASLLSASQRGKSDV